MNYIIQIYNVTNTNKLSKKCHKILIIKFQIYKSTTVKISFYFLIINSQVYNVTIGENWKPERLLIQVKATDEDEVKDKVTSIR